jgi:hypothetical protein
MLNKLKFIPLILISLFTLSFAVQAPLSSDSYDYRFRISAAGDMWLYDGVVDGIVEHCQYTKYDNNPYVNPNFNESAFKKDSFYAQSGPATKSPSGYFDNPASLYKFLGYETINGNQILKYETYSWVMKPGDHIQKNCVQCNTKAGEYFDSTTGLCVNKCEDITNQSDRLNCMCKRAGKIGYSGDFVTMRIFSDGPHDDHFLCNYGCETTKDDPEARPNGDYTKYSVSYDIKDTDPNANGVCFADDTYAPNAMPAPNPKPDDPGNNNGTKPGGDNPKPDDPGNNNGTKPGGGGGKPGGPGNNNGTNPGGKPDNPGNNNGTKPGGDDDKGKFDPKDFDDGGLGKARDDLYGGIKDHLNNGLSKFDGVRDGIDQFISNVKGKGFSKVKSEIKRSCPIKKEIQLSDGKSYEIVVDYCDAVAPASEISYYVFYVFFIVGIFLLLLKLYVVLI